MSPARCQRTVAQPSTVQGFGYFSGKDITVEFRPAPVGAGLTFVRRDLGPEARVPVCPSLRIDAPRRTTLEVHGVRVEMVEHILAALGGLGVDNCAVWVDAGEMPACEGSALPFVEALDSIGFEEQDAPVRQIVVTKPIRVEGEGRWIEARPPKADGLSIEFELDYGPGTPIGRQVISLDITPDVFRTEIAPCRTFVMEVVAQAMRSQGLGRRVTPKDLLIFGPDGPIDNPLRFDDECVRHKVLDVVGDLALTGCEVVAHVVGCRCGHELHAELARRLLELVGQQPLVDRRCA